MDVRKIKWIATTFALVITQAASVVAQQTDAAYQRARAALPAAQRSAFESILTSARARRIPTAPLIDKVLEGAAKGMPADRILSVVRTRVDHLAKAQSLSPTSTPTEIVEIDLALQRGIPEQTVRDLKVKAKANEPFGLALHTYMDLVETGVPESVAGEVLTGWRARGGRSSDLRDLPAAVERLIREGAPPARAGTAVAAALRAGNPAGTARIGPEVRGNVPQGPKITKPPAKPKGSPPGQAKKGN